MSNTARRIRLTIQLLHERGHLAPDHAMASAAKLMETTPLPPGFAFASAGLLRHAAILAPFDRNKLRLAEDVNTPMRHVPFDKWLSTAHQLTDLEPVPENLPMPTTPEDLVRYMETQTANVMRLPALLRLRHLGDIDAFQAGVQTISGSPSGMLAAPIMAWQAHFLGEHFLAVMLLDEGISNFLTQNLRALHAFQSKDKEKALSHLVHTLELEPFQPGIIAILADLADASSTELVIQLESLHDKIAQKMNLADLEAVNESIRDDDLEDFLRVLETATPYFRSNATIFWQTLAQDLR